MSCCGGKRPGGPALPGIVMTPSHVRPALAVFRYEGESAIVVTGRVTGTMYRFARPGSEVAVDVRDGPSVRQVPRLREIRPA
jgi:hypothetical protein